MGATTDAKENIAKIPGVLRVEMVYGRSDIIAEVEAKDLKGLDQITDNLKNVSCILSTESFICHEFAGNSKK